MLRSEAFLLSWLCAKAGPAAACHDLKPRLCLSQHHKQLEVRLDHLLLQHMPWGWLQLRFQLCCALLAAAEESCRPSCHPCLVPSLQVALLMSLEHSL